MTVLGMTPIAFDPNRWSMDPPSIAEGVLGYTSDYLGVHWIGLIIAAPDGEGHVGRYLDGLTQDKVIVIEPRGRLVGMLDRRGFRAAQVVSPMGEIIDVRMRVVPA